MLVSYYYFNISWMSSDSDGWETHHNKANDGEGYGVVWYKTTDSRIITDRQYEGKATSAITNSWSHYKVTEHFKYTYRDYQDVRFGCPAKIGKQAKLTLYIVPLGFQYYDIYQGKTWIADETGLTSIRDGDHYRTHWDIGRIRTIELGEPDIDESLKDRGRDQFFSIVNREVGWDPGALTAMAMSNSQGLSINSLQYMREVPSIARTFKDVLGGISALKKGDIKGVAGSFLAAKYGTSNTVRDTVEIAKYLSTGKTSARQHFHASASGIVSGSHHVITYKDTFSAIATPACSNVPSKMVSALRDADLLPSLENLWDAVPYSFVVDWVLPVGELLSSIDAGMDLLRYNFGQTYYSRLTTWYITSSGFDQTFTHFERWPYSGPVNPVGLSSYSKPSGNHFLEASALIVQRA